MSRLDAEELIAHIEALIADNSGHACLCEDCEICKAVLARLRAGGDG